ncbi:hypothetical protein [Myxococcus llanfairpwllgwyngyllgogerychwyrndrobwllllantysiliogogogochensis]|uniref:hypothetical protein n=1 Tax=Myxococcus llanfairpwllgwyngyllgogerychwyrndrobwllllantysiliogogogochensis TaxID=2590453 RepID=UPI0015F10F88|nr:hypothetical protein [Myxococcus llanfairpwllgwyngyllgogerychwyrndrobwllllantysiliogogogochensis]
MNDAQCSKAQRNAQEFVEDRLKNALNGQYGIPAQQGAQTIEQAMGRGADFELHLIRVSMPRNGTLEYQQGNPITATCYPWGETGGRGGQPVVILQRCDSITYMDSACDEPPVGLLRGEGQHREVPDGAGAPRASSRLSSWASPTPPPGRPSASPRSPCRRSSRTPLAGAMTTSTVASS